MYKLKRLYCSFSHHFWQCTEMKSQTNKKEHNISAIHFAAQVQEAYNAHVCCTSTVWGIFLTSAFFEDIARWNVLKPWKALREVVLTYTEKKKKYTEQKKKKSGKGVKRRMKCPFFLHLPLLEDRKWLGQTEGQGQSMLLFWHKTLWSI